MPKKTKVIIKKLGRYRVNGNKVLGLAYFEANLIMADPSYSERELLNTIIHEKLHLLYPLWSETKINITANRLASLLWSQNYRRTNTNN